MSTWQPARVVEILDETARAKSIVLELAAFPEHLPGQHVDLRLTTHDAPQAQRSYALASAPEDGYVVLTVELVQGGVLSPHLVDDIRSGDELELRGPIGDQFVWEPSVSGPVLLVADGSGIVPFRSMLRHRAAVGSGVPVRLLYSSPSWDDVIYRDELLRLAAYDEVDIRLALKSEWPDGWPGHRGRIDRALLEALAWPVRQRPLTFVCGPHGFVDRVASELAQLDQAPGQLRTEHFGPGTD